MHGGPQSAIQKLIDKVTSLDNIARAEAEALRALTVRVSHVAGGSAIVSDGTRIVECCLLLDGFACRHKVASDGGRQIVSFHIPGDILDTQHLLFDRADHNIEAITAARIAYFPTRELRELVQARPGLARAFWRGCLVEASIFREWVLNVGRRDAKMRVAHMLCEFVERCVAAGLGSAQGFTLPMSQEDIADATGLTSVHVNRMMRSLREEGVIEGSGRAFRIIDWERMKHVADFHPDYLHLSSGSEVGERTARLSAARPA